MWKVTFERRFPSYLFDFWWFLRELWPFESDWHDRKHKPHTYPTAHMATRDTACPCGPQWPAAPCRTLWHPAVSNKWASKKIDVFLDFASQYNHGPGVSLWLHIHCMKIIAFLILDILKCFWLHPDFSEAFKSEAVCSPTSKASSTHTVLDRH
jgi:hypothetical protein